MTGLYGSPDLGPFRGNEPPKRRRRIPIWLWLPFAIIGGLVALLIAISLIVAIAEVASGKVGLSPSPSAPAVPTSTLSVTAAPGSLLDVSGTGPKVTGRFVSKGAWDLAWSYGCGANPGGFSAEVYDSNNQPTSFGVNDFGPRATGVKHYTDAGTYYLQVSSSCSWHVVVRPG